MYLWIINLLETMGITNININFCGQPITIYTAQAISGLITLTLLACSILIVVKILLLPSKFFHGLYHKWAKKRGIKK